MNAYKQKVIIAISVAFLSLTGLFFISPNTALGASSLYISPGSGSFNVGQSFSVSVYASSPDKWMNAVWAVLSFPADKLSISSISKTGSIINFWVQEPSFSNSAGSASLEGIILNPGYQGSSGKLGTINFAAKSAGAAQIKFTQGSILANDGQGSNILSSMSGGSFNIGGGSGPVPSNSTEPPSAPAAGPPSPPQVNSSTHPDPDKWFSSNNPHFSWSNPSGTIGVNILANREPESDPGNSSDGLFDNYGYSTVEQGVWYFHIKLRNTHGWGQTAHYKFQIDTEKPETFSISPASDATIEPGSVALRLEANDRLSGVSHYEIAINDSESLVWKDNGEHILQIQSLAPGAYSVRARAYDYAGNYREATSAFTIAAHDPALAIVKASGSSADEPLSDPKFNFVTFLSVLGLLVVIVFLVFRLYGYFVKGEMSSFRLASWRSNLKKVDEDIGVLVGHLEKTADKRKLTTEEVETLKTLKSDLEPIEHINNQIADHNRVVEGVFDGQSMLGVDGKKYVVPTNYASKTKLVQGDILKLQISDGGEFIYKVIAPIERVKQMGVLKKVAANDYRVISDGKEYKVLLASVYYHRLDPGDEIQIVMPAKQDTEWAAIESIKVKTIFSRFEQAVFPDKPQSSAKTKKINKTKKPIKKQLTRRSFTPKK